MLVSRFVSPRLWRHRGLAMFWLFAPKQLDICRLDRKCVVCHWRWSECLRLMGRGWSKKATCARGVFCGRVSWSDLVDCHVLKRSHLKGKWGLKVYCCEGLLRRGVLLWKWRERRGRPMLPEPLDVGIYYFTKCITYWCWRREGHISLRETKKEEGLVQRGIQLEQLHLGRQQHQALSPNRLVFPRTTLVHPLHVQRRRCFGDTLWILV